MLGQLLGAAVQPPAAATAMPVVVATQAQLTGEAAELDEMSDAAESLDGALQAMLPLAVAPPVAMPTATRVESSVANAVASVIPQTVASPALLSGNATKLIGASLPDLLAADFAAAPTANDFDAAMFANLNAAQSFPVDDVQQLGAAAKHHAPAAQLQSPVGSAQWGDELGLRLNLMAERGQHSASLRLSPEHLGPLEIRIAVQDDKASVWFGAAHADTRAAIEQALPRLRELFVSQGLTLADTGVFHEAPRDQSRPQPHSRQGETASTEPEVRTISVAYRKLGLVDAYA